MKLRVLGGRPAAKGHFPPRSAGASLKLPPDVLEIPRLPLLSPAFCGGLIEARRQ